MERGSCDGSAHTPCVYCSCERRGGDGKVPRWLVVLVAAIHVPATGQSAVPLAEPTQFSPSARQAFRSSPSSLGRVVHDPGLRRINVHIQCCSWRQAKHSLRCRTVATEIRDPGVQPSLTNTPTASRQLTVLRPATCRSPSKSLWPGRCSLNGETGHGR